MWPLVLKTQFEQKNKARKFKYNEKPIEFWKKSFKTRANDSILDWSWQEWKKKTFESFIIYYIVGRCIMTFQHVHNNVIKF